MDDFRARLAAALVSFALLSCGGGGGGSPPAPQISNLQFSPTSAFVNTGPASIMGTMQFTDPGGHLATLQLTTSAGAQQTISLQAAAGLTSGTLQGSFSVDTSQLGHFTFEVWVVDANGKASNHLSGAFDVVIDDVAQSWSAQASNTLVQLNRVAWTGSQFIVVGYSGTILTSPDGVTWTRQSSGTTADLTAVAWTGSRLVVIGNDRSALHPGTLLTSPDGVTWTVSTSTLPLGQTASMTGLTWSGSKLVAVGYDGANLGGIVLTSPDGLSWTSVTPVPVNLLENVSWNGSQFLAGGSLNNVPAVMRSSDGLTWSADTINPGSATGIIYDLINSGTGSASTEVAIGGALLVDRAGAGWQVDTTTLPVGGSPPVVGWSGSHFLACVGNTCELSSDGVQWAPTSISPVGAVRSMIWAGRATGAGFRWASRGRSPRRLESVSINHQLIWTGNGQTAGHLARIVHTGCSARRAAAD